MGHRQYPKGPSFRVNVTPEIITTSTVANSRMCMIAEALKKAQPDATAVMVDVATVRFTDRRKGLRYVYVTPYTAQVALLKFDDGQVPQPFSFKLMNAHVSAAGTRGVRHAREAAAAVAAAAEAGQTIELTKSKRLRRPSKRNDDLPTKAIIVGGRHREHQRVVGGRRPPQLKTMRLFGVRAFAGANDARLAQLDEQQRAKVKSA